MFVFFLSNCLNYQSIWSITMFTYVLTFISSTGLERVAEELMGRRKWKQYQESSAQSDATDLLEKQSPSIGEFLNIFIHTRKISNKKEISECVVLSSRDLIYYVHSSELKILRYFFWEYNVLKKIFLSLSQYFDSIEKSVCHLIWMIFKSSFLRLFQNNKKLETNCKKQKRIKLQSKRKR